MIRVCCLLLLLLVSCSSLVVPLSQDYRQFVYENPLVLIQFYLPRGHSRGTLHALDKMDERESLPVALAEVNCHQMHKLCDQLAINSFPALRFMVKGDPIIYHGEHEMSKVRQWVKNLITQDLSVISSTQISKRVGSQTFVIVKGLDHDQLAIVWMASKIAVKQINYWILEEELPPEQRSDINMKSGSQEGVFIKLYRHDGTICEFPMYKLAPNQLQRWSFDQTRQIILSMQSKQYVDYYGYQRDYEYILAWLDMQDFVAGVLGRYMHEVCQANRHKLLCIRVERGMEMMEVWEEHFGKGDGKSRLAIIRRDWSLGYLQNAHQQTLLDDITTFIEEALADNRPRVVDNLNPIKYSHAQRLTSTNFYSTLESEGYVLVQFYQTHCEQAFEAAQGFDRVAKHFRDKRVKVVAVDIDIEEQIGKKQGVYASPSYYIYVNGDGFEYQGDTSPFKLIDFMEAIIKSKIPQMPKQLNTDKAYLVLSGVAQDSSLHVLPALFSKIAVYSVNQAATQPQKKVQLHQQDGYIITYSGQIKISLIIRWLRHHTEPVLMSFGDSKHQHRIQNALQSQDPLLLLVDPNGQKEVQQVMQVMQTWCRGRQKLLCGYAHHEDPDYAEMVEWIGQQFTHASLLLIIDLKNMKKYYYQDEIHTISSVTLDAFVHSFKGQQLQGVDWYEEGEQEDVEWESIEREEDLQEL